MNLTKFYHLSFTVMLIFIFTASINLFAKEKKISEKEVPAAVLKSFHSTYPNAKIKGLSTEIEKGIKYFEIESMDGTVRRDLLYMNSGKVAEIEETILSSELPKGAIQSINKKIPGGKIERSEKVTSGSKITYELSVVGKTGKYSVVLNKLGEISKVAKENSKTGDED